MTKYYTSNKWQNSTLVINDKIVQNITSNKWQNSTLVINDKIVH